MTLKLAMLALALLVAWFVLFRPRRKAPPGTASRPASRPVTSLERCPRCGIYRLPGGDCACDSPSAAG